MLRRIHVALELAAAPEHRAGAAEVHATFADRCPLYRSLRGAVAIRTELALRTA